MNNISTELNSVRVAIYVRVSTHWQIDKDSLPVQKEELTAYAKYVLNATSYEIFEDAGYSAKNTDRPDYQKMLARIRKGEFTHLLVWKLDRISRNLLDFTQMYNELKKLGVTFVSKNEQFDTSSAIGEAMLKIILVFAELERKMTAERVTAIMIARAGNGQWNGGRVPFGYSYDKETHAFSINEPEAAIVRKIYELYESTHSLLQASKLLNEMGSRHRSGKPWSPVSLSLILKSPFYIGDYRYNMRAMSKRDSRQDVKPESEWITIENHHLAIIERQRWLTVVEQLTRNSRGWLAGGKTYQRKNVHVFAGLLTCGVCGAHMVANKSCRPDKYGFRASIYACPTRRRFSTCTNKYVTDNEIGPFVLNYIANMIRAKNSFGKSTTPETLQKKLLRGEMFANVERIKESGLMQLYDLYRQDVTGIEYTRDNRDLPRDSKPSEQDILLGEKRRLERALSRLKSLYLYADNDMPEKDYILAKSELDASLQKVNDRLNAIEKDLASKFAMSDDELFDKATYFLLTMQLSSKRFVDYQKLLRVSDPLVLKNFITAVSSNFCIKNGRVMSITFKNGITHEFIYKDSE